MGLIAEDNGMNFELTPADTHVARCYRVIDFGTSYNEKWGKSSHKILISWELPNTHMEDDRPFSIGRKYTLSLNKKANLRIDLESWRGVAFTEEEVKGFDISKLIGATCLLGVVHDTREDRTYANITSVMKMPQGTPCPDLINPPVVFDLDNFDQEVFNSFSEGLQKAIGASEEYQLRGQVGLQGESPSQSAEELDVSSRGSVDLEDIPF